jgi:hypothetical protein
MNTVGKISSLAVIALTLGGCAATQTMIAKKDLDVQARTSTAIFVDPVAKEKRTIYLDVKSGVAEFDRRQFKQFVSEQFTQVNDNGYRIIDDPSKAQYTMVVYVLNLEKASPTAAQQALGQGYMGGAVLAGAAVGTLHTHDPYGGAVKGGLIGGGLEMVTGNLVKDVTFMLVCDVQIKERAAKGVIVRKDSSINTKISDAGTSQQTSSEVSNQKEYRTRIVTTANKANLDLAEAEPVMFKKTAYAMSGFF